MISRTQYNRGPPPRQWGLHVRSLSCFMGSMGTIRDLVASPDRLHFGVRVLPIGVQSDFDYFLFCRVHSLPRRPSLDGGDLPVFRHLSTTAAAHRPLQTPID